MNLIRFASFLSLFSLIYFGMHFIIYIRLAAPLLAGEGSSALFKLFLVTGALTFYGGMFYRVYPPLYGLLRIGHPWLGFISIAFTAAIVKLPFDILFPDKCKSITIVFLLFAAIISMYSLYNGSRPVRISDIRIAVKGLPAENSSIKIVLMSDLHLSRLKDSGWLSEIVKSLNEQKPDIVTLAGDLIDDDAESLEKFIPVMNNIHSRYGVFAVAGNHDHYSSLNNFRSFSEMSGIRIIQDERITVAGILDILGVDDENDSLMKQYPIFLKRALLGSSHPVMLVRHRPLDFEVAADSGIFLQLSGHTHAGQIPPLDLIVQFLFKYPWGLYGYKNSYIYTTCGTGTWGPAMRLFSKSELTVITLSSVFSASKGEP